MKLEDLKEIGERVKSTVKFLLEENKSSESEIEQKLHIILNNVRELCDGNERLALGIMKIALKDLIIKDEGELMFMINEVNRMSLKRG